MSRAIMVLGFETVRSIAVSLLLFEQMADRERASQLREAFLRASLSGSIARALSGGSAREAELKLVRAIRNQVVLAFQQARSH